VSIYFVPYKVVMYIACSIFHSICVCPFQVCLFVYTVTFLTIFLDLFNVLQYSSVDIVKCCLQRLYKPGGGLFSRWNRVIIRSKYKKTILVSCASVSFYHQMEKICTHVRCIVNLGSSQIFTVYNHGIFFSSKWFL